VIVFEDKHRGMSLIRGEHTNVSDLCDINLKINIYLFKGGK